MKLYSVVLRVGECLIDLESLAYKLWVSCCMPVVSTLSRWLHEHTDHEGILQIIVDINHFSYLKVSPVGLYIKIFTYCRVAVSGKTRSLRSFSSVLGERWELLFLNL